MPVTKRPVDKVGKDKCGACGMTPSNRWNHPALACFAFAGLRIGGMPTGEASRVVDANLRAVQALAKKRAGSPGPGRKRGKVVGYVTVMKRWEGNPSVFKGWGLGSHSMPTLWKDPKDAVSAESANWSHAAEVRLLRIPKNAALRKGAGKRGGGR